LEVREAPPRLDWNPRTSGVPCWIFTLHQVSKCITGEMGFVTFVANTYTKLGFKRRVRVVGRKAEGYWLDAGLIVRFLWCPQLADGGEWRRLLVIVPRRCFLRQPVTRLFMVKMDKGWACSSQRWTAEDKRTRALRPEALRLEDGSRPVFA